MDQQETDELKRRKRRRDAFAAMLGIILGLFGSDLTGLLTMFFVSRGTVGTAVQIGNGQGAGLSGAANYGVAGRTAAVQFMTLIQQTAPMVAYIARQAMGRPGAMDAGDAAAASVFAAGQAQYVDKFISDIEGGRYDTEGGKNEVIERAKLYVERMRGFANQEAKREASRQDGLSTKVRWILDPLVEDHCDTCLEMAAGNWTLASLPRVPGDGSTGCGVNCHCDLVTDGFGRITL